MTATTVKLNGRTDPERIERAARIYSSNKNASAAMGITPGAFSRLCKRYGITPPHQRRRARDQANRKRKG